MSGGGKHREYRLGPVQCLDLSLFVDAEHESALGRVHVQADDVTDLVHTIDGRASRYLAIDGLERDRGKGRLPASARTARSGTGTVPNSAWLHATTAASCVVNEKGPTCAGFLVRAVDLFRAHGIDGVEQPMTDNAWAYNYSLHEVWAEPGTTKKSNKPIAPWQNGKVERLNRTPHSGSRVDRVRGPRDLVSQLAASKIRPHERRQRGAGGDTANGRAAGVAGSVRSARGCLSKELVRKRREVG